MSEVVYVKTLEEWKSILDVWFKKGYKWYFNTNRRYNTQFFLLGTNQIYVDNCKICFYPDNSYNGDDILTYEEFMEQQEKNMQTYYVTHEQLEAIKFLKGFEQPLKYLIFNSASFESVIINISKGKEKAILRYLGGDDTIIFKVQEQLYRLCHIEKNGNVHYMVNWQSRTSDKMLAFTATLEEIKQYETPDWIVERVES